MTYMSLAYYAIVLVAVFLYYLLPKKSRWIILLSASGYFYYLVVSDTKQILVFLFSIFVSYFAGVILEEHKEKWMLMLGIVFSILPLFLYRMITLIQGTIGYDVSFHLVIPIGISFYSLQMVSYLVDVYRKKTKAQRNIFKYGLFASFFPLIIQGPISRYDQIAPQLFEGHSYDEERFMKGIQLIIWGFFLKYMIADKASVFVNAIFADYEYYGGVYVWIAAILYSVQLYTDFLSCVTISQGVAGLFGIDIMDNFVRPYFATSIKDFWRRWHVSLSSWLRDYIYIPLGGNRKGKVSKYKNLMITFLISGLWHGGSWKYIVWGGMHAGYQIVGELCEDKRNQFMEKGHFPKGSQTRIILSRLGTFLLVMFTWVIFRADSLKAGAEMILSMFTTFNPWALFDYSLFGFGLLKEDFLVLCLAIFVLILIEILQEKGFVMRDWFAKQNLVVRWGIYLCAIWSIWIMGTYGFGFNAADFIYGGF